MPAETAEEIRNPILSLADLLGDEYIEAVCDARAFVEGTDPAALRAVAREKVEFFPPAFRRRMDELLGSVGGKVSAGLQNSASGAGTRAFREATRTALAPLTGFGFLRIGEDGRVYLAAKSEHYHSSLGHSFPGYALIEKARRLGIPNSTHNNTRGHITRRAEEELVRAANGLPRGHRAALETVLASEEPRVLNRVINLETGSLAVEAALKMMLARFYRLDRSCPEPKYAGRTPVFLVLADNEGGRTANYHGTTLLTQTMRGLWPELLAGLERAGLFRVQPVAINDIRDFRARVEELDRGGSKVAGFFHELILMNYGGVRLDPAYVRQAHALCAERDIPTMVDEIQSCIWSPELFLFREYGLKPDFVSVGKGFPGGEYPASRILASAPYDNLNQFGALVTNGQEELASLAYLITIEFALANRDYTRAIGDYYERELKGLARRHERLVERIEGQRHLSSIYFRTADQAVRFMKALNGQGIDISAHTYKAKCPPSNLTKIPLIATRRMVDFLINKMDETLKGMQEG
jgi:acetylornithine/succinyldiaminopimelate/putrescine aminotransferase